MPRATAKKASTAPAQDLDPQAPIVTEADLDHSTDGVDDLGFTNLDSTEDKINILYYGPEGTGKTTDIAMMANLPGSGRVLVVNSEGGLKKRALTKRGVDTSRIVLWPPAGTRINKRNLEALYERVRADLTDDPDTWKGIAIDSLTEIAQVLRENATETRYAGLEAAGKPYDPDFIDRGDYGVQTDQATKLLRKFRDLPCHFAVTALERNDDGVFGPALNPALASAVLGYVDFVLYCKATQATAETPSDEESASEFRAATRQGKTYRAKDRFDVLPRVLADPTFDRVYSYVMEELTEEADVLQQEYLERKAERDAKMAEEKAAREARRAEVRKNAKKP